MCRPGAHAWLCIAVVTTTVALQGQVQAAASCGAGLCGNGADTCFKCNIGLGGYADGKTSQFCAGIPGMCQQKHTACRQGEAHGGLRADANTDCKPCPAGLYMDSADVANQVWCKPQKTCGANQFLDLPSGQNAYTAIGECTACSSGQIQQAAGVCDAPENAQKAGAQEVSCPGGDTSHHVETTCKWRCSPGQCVDAEETCRACMAGIQETYSYGDGRETCVRGKVFGAFYECPNKHKACAKGEAHGELTKTGPALCTACPVGLYMDRSDIANQVWCLPQKTCGANQFLELPRGQNAYTALGECKPCTGGQIQDASGVCSAPQNAQKAGKQEVRCPGGDTSRHVETTCKWRQGQCSPGQCADAGGACRACMSGINGVYSYAGGTEAKCTGGAMMGMFYECPNRQRACMKGEAHGELTKTGPAACTACPDGLYMDRTDVANQVWCKPQKTCSANQFLELPNGESAHTALGECTACKSGKFQDASGVCSASKNAQKAGTQEVSCPSGDTSHHVETACKVGQAQCSPGQCADAEGTCRACVAGVNGVYSYAGGRETCVFGKVFGAFYECPNKHKACAKGEAHGELTKTGPALCTACPVGLYMDRSDIANQVWCLPQKTCGANQFLELPRGQNAYTALGECKPCTGGQIQDASGVCSAPQNAQKAGKQEVRCPGGDTSHHMETACKPNPTCKAGQYKDASDSTCIPCASGTFQDQPNFAGGSCTKHTVCGKGTKLTGLSTENAETCEVCPDGTYQPSDNFEYAMCAAQSHCSAGQKLYQKDFTKAVGCTNCAAGQYQLDAKYLGYECTKHTTKCAAGFKVSAQTKTAVQTCSACNALSYQTAAAHTEQSCTLQIKCPAGTRLSTTNTWQKGICKTCAFGTYQAQSDFQGLSCTEQPVCRPGTALKEITLTKKTECRSCPDGTYQDQASNSAFECAKQPDCNTQGGQYATLPDEFKSTTQQSAECKKCRPGYEYQLPSNDSELHFVCQKQPTSSDCQPGQRLSGISTTKKETCVPCGENEWSVPQTDWHDATSFEKCTAHVTCNPGEHLEHLDNDKAAACVKCAGKAYVDATSHQSIKCWPWKSCVAGQYLSGASLKKSGECKLCGINSFQNDSGFQGAWCTPHPQCNPATDEVLVGCGSLSDSCTKPGNTQRGVCATCQNKTEFPGTPCKTLQTCGKGERVVGNAKTEKNICEACPSGTYQNSDHHQETECKPVKPQATKCGLGEYVLDASSTASRTVCGKCSAGMRQYMDQMEHREKHCRVHTECGRGEKLSGTSTTQPETCEECPHDTYQDGERHRNTECKPQATCSAGEILMGTSRETIKHCKPCPDLQYQTKEGHRETTCKEQTTCTQGKRLSSLDKDKKGTCEPCPELTFIAEQFPHRMIECQAQASCGAGERLVATSNAGVSVKVSPDKEGKCAQCPNSPQAARSYQDLVRHQEFHCKAWALTCGEGFHMSTYNMSAKPLCSACLAGTYQPASGHQIDRCKKQTACTFGWRITAASKVQAQACLPCNGDQYLDEETHRTEVCKSQPVCSVDQFYRNASNGDGRHAKATCVPCPTPSKLGQPLTSHREGSCTKMQAMSSDGAAGGTTAAVVVAVAIFMVLAAGAGSVYAWSKKRNQNSDALEHQSRDARNHCDQCGAGNTPGFRFCSSCGTHASATVAETSFASGLYDEINNEVSTSSVMSLANAAYNDIGKAPVPVADTAYVEPRASMRQERTQPTYDAINNIVGVAASGVHQEPTEPLEEGYGPMQLEGGHGPIQLPTGSGGACNALYQEFEVRPCDSAAVAFVVPPPFFCWHTHRISQKFEVRTAALSILITKPRSTLCTRTLVKCGFTLHSR